MKVENSLDWTERREVVEAEVESFHAHIHQNSLEAWAEERKSKEEERRKPLFEKKRKAAGKPKERSAKRLEYSKYVSIFSTPNFFQECQRISFMFE